MNGEPNQHKTGNNHCSKLHPASLPFVLSFPALHLFAFACLYISVL